MRPKFTLLDLINRLWGHISLRRRSEFALLILLMILSSFAEVFSIGAIIPFLGVLTDPNRIYGESLLQPLINFIGIKNSHELIMPITIIFSVMALLAGILRLIMLWVSTRLSFSAGADFSISIYRRTLYQPYVMHLNRNSSEVINGISTKTNVVIHNFILPILSLISSTMMLIVISIALISLSPLISIVAFVGFGFIYIIIVRLTRKRILINSQLIASESTQVIKSLQEGLGGIRDVLIDGSQSEYCKIYSESDGLLRRAQANTSFIAQSPRFMMEAAGMILIAAMAYLLALQPDGVLKAVPILGVLALGAQRMLPVLQIAYSSWINIRGNLTSVEDIADLLDQPLPKNQGMEQKLLPYEKKLVLSNINFSYTKEEFPVLKNINLIIPKGSRFGFIGTTGSGKTTLLDIIMGLLTPTSGEIKVDDEIISLKNMRSWQAHIAQVPQSIFLADSTIAENIAFGVAKNMIDEARVRMAAEKAQLSSLIEKWPNKYKTMVGERGAKLSGGQRQRIGIARALYKRADVIIFDEATSALDNKTEDDVMSAIELLDHEITILIVAHRLTTLKKCNAVVEICNGSIVKIGDYNEIINYPIQFIIPT